MGWFSVQWDGFDVPSAFGGFLQQTKATHSISQGTLHLHPRKWGDMEQGLLIRQNLYILIKWYLLMTFLIVFDPLFLTAIIVICDVRLNCIKLWKHGFL